MKPMRSAEEFQVILDKALAEHERQGLTHVSHRIIKQSVNSKEKGMNNPTPKGEVANMPSKSLESRSTEKKL